MVSGWCIWGYDVFLDFGVGVGFREVVGTKVLQVDFFRVYYGIGELANSCWFLVI